MQAYFIEGISEFIVCFPHFSCSLLPRFAQTETQCHILKSPGGSTLQCDTRLWDDMGLNSPKRPPYWNSSSGFDFDHITAVDMSFGNRHQSAKFYPNRTAHSRKMTSRRFSRRRISAILDFRDPIMGSMKSACTTSDRSSIETIALNCFVFEKIAFLHFGDKIRDGGFPPSLILEVQ